MRILMLLLVLLSLQHPIVSQCDNVDEYEIWKEICIQTLGEDKGKELLLQILDAKKNDDTVRFLKIMDSLQTKDLLNMGNVMVGVDDRRGLGANPELSVTAIVMLPIAKRLDLDLDVTSDACLNVLQDKTLHPRWRALIAYNLLFEPYESVKNEKGILIRKRYGIDSLSEKNKQKWLKVLVHIREDASEDTQVRRNAERSIEKLQYILK